MRRTYHIISNPAAGKTKSGKSLQIVQDVFTESGAAFETHLTERAGDATEIARRLTENGETEIIALGGDGTLHEVLNGLADPSACNFGLIPSGTGNDFAEKIGLPLDADATARIVLKGEVKETDYLEVGGMRCMNVAGVGMDVDVLERCQKGKMKGKLKYFKSLLQSLFSFKGYRVEVQSEEVTETRDVLLAAACNGAQCGGGIRICPAADVADGKLDVVIVDFLGGKWKIIKAFMALLKGKILEYPAAKHFLCDTVKLLPKQDCAMQLDGELYRGVPFDVKLRRGLKFYR